MNMKNLLEAAGEVATSGLNNLPPSLRLKVAKSMEDGDALEVVVRIRDGMPAIDLRLVNDAGEVTQLARLAVETH